MPKFNMYIYNKQNENLKYVRIILIKLKLTNNLYFFITSCTRSGYHSQIMKPTTCFTVGIDEQDNQDSNLYNSVAAT